MAKGDKGSAGKKGTKAKKAKPAKKKQRAKGGPDRTQKARFLGKLDPLLTLAATRAKQEKKALGDLAQAYREDRQAVPTSVSAMPLGAASLESQLSSASARKLAEEDLVPVLVEARDASAVEKKIDSLKGRSRRLTDRTLLVRVPRSGLETMAKMAAVDYVEAATRLRPHCDLAHGSTGLLREGGVTVPQTGKGVVVGVVDTGIDVSHPAFRNKDGSTRIVRYIDQEAGKEYDAEDIDAGEANGSVDEIGHGTHVAGIAAGNGAGSPKGRFRGVAPEADLAIVKTTFLSSDIADAVAQVFDVAGELGKPCVVNLSLGGHVGGHDGTTVTERTIDQLSGPGRLVVVSAGNEAQDRVHAGTELPRDSHKPARWVADFELRSRRVGNSIMGLLVVQVWHQHEDDLRVRLRSPNGESFEAPTGGAAETDRGVFFVQAVHQQAPYSGDHSTTFLVAALPQPQWLRGWSVIVEEDRSGTKHGVEVGAVHAWIRDREEGSFTKGYTRSHLVGMPGTSYSAITTASYATRREWTSRDPLHPDVVLGEIHFEDVSYFSSPGPTREGHNKPEIAAPGQWLIAPLSADASLDFVPDWTRQKDIEYTAMQGTSMSAPYVTGALALLLEKVGDLDWAEAKRRLIKSARQDSFTWPCWNARWGYGKLNLERLLTIEP